MFHELVRSKTIDYSGEEVSHALPLRLQELLPGLPVAGVAGSLSAVNAATGDVRAWVLDPSLTLKPPECWPGVPPKARINATKDEWYSICEVLFHRGIIEPIDYTEIFKVGDTPVLNGAFAVEKRGKAGVGQCRVTRLIMNFVPANSFQRLMAGDLSTLSGSSAWAQLVLEPNQGSSCGAEMIRRGLFMRGNFHVVGVRTWLSAGPCPVTWWDQRKQWEYVASRVIPMGWIQAVSLFSAFAQEPWHAPAS